MTADFQIVRSNDLELLTSLHNMVSDTAVIACQKTIFTFVGGGDLPIDIADLATNAAIAPCREDGVRIIERLRIETNYGNVSIERPSGIKPFDTVKVDGTNPNKQGHQFAPLTAYCQKHLASVSTSGLKDVLGEGASNYLEARDVALARLETLIPEFMRRIHDARLEQESEFSNRRNELEQQHADLKRSLEEQDVTRRQQIEEQRQKLLERENSLNLQEPKTERRRVFEELKTTLVLNQAYFAAFLR